MSECSLVQSITEKSRASTPMYQCHAAAAYIFVVALLTEMFRTFSTSQSYLSVFR